MKHISILIIILIAALSAACAVPQSVITPPTATATPPPPTLLPDTATLPPPSATISPARATKTPRFKIQKSLTESSSGGEPASVQYPLSENGPFFVGRRTFSATDSSRPTRKISITVWYPALLAAGETTPYAVPDAEPDNSGAPYPLLLSSTKLARIFAPNLVSYGFTWASIDNIDTYEQTNPEMLQQPLDILFALELVASNPPQGLEDMFAAEHAGVIGYSFDGYNALALSGARIDPQNYLALCKDPLQTRQSVSYWFEGSYNCRLALKWEQFTSLAGEELTVSQDGLWQPITDPRISAVMPLAADGYYLFGDAGLAAVRTPAMFIVGTRDDLYRENALIYEHIGSSEKTFISILNRDHIAVIYEPEMRVRLRHFAVAFFGYHLQGKQEYAQYFSQEFVDQLDGMLWGVYGEN